MSSVHKSEIAVSANVNLAGDMGTRAEIVARLRQLPEVLGKTDAEIAETCGITPQMWSNYKSEGASENIIRPLVALELWNAFAIPMEWVYDGQTSRADGEMRSKLAQANRRAEAWLASRQPTRRRNPIASIALAALTGATLLAGCATAGVTWKRLDGAPVGNEHIQAAKLACDGEATKANLAAGTEAALTVFGYSRAMTTIFEGCMADHGYLPETPIR